MTELKDRGKGFFFPYMIKLRFPDLSPNKDCLGWQKGGEVWHVQAQYASREGNFVHVHACLRNMLFWAILE